MESLESEVDAQKTYEYKVRILPKPVTYFFGSFLYLWALYMTFITIVNVITIFDLSIAAGLVLAFTPLGWIFFGPAILITWAAPSFLIEYTESIKNNWEYYIKLIFGYLVAFILPYVVFLVLMSILGLAIIAAGIDVA